MVIFSVFAKGTNENLSGSTASKVNGGVTLSRSCMPMASLALFLPTVMCSFSCISIMERSAVSSTSTPKTAAHMK